jgi:hypothetical protein
LNEEIQKSLNCGWELNIQAKEENHFLEKSSILKVIISNIFSTSSL